MKRALLLVDLQNDYLRTEGLQPSARELVKQVAVILNACRRGGVPVMHCLTTVANDEDRMPHWKRSGKRACIPGTEGHGSPAEIAPIAGELAFHKTFFDPFRDGSLDAALRRLEVGTVLIAGLHLHACVRAAAMSAYERGFEVVIVDDAVGSDEPDHALVTRRWLRDRVASFEPAGSLAARISAGDSRG